MPKNRDSDATEWSPGFKIFDFYDCQFWRSFIMACSSLSVLYRGQQFPRYGRRDWQRGVA